MIEHRRELKIAVIGCGHWGPNHVRVFSEIDRAEVVAVADLNPTRLAWVRERYPTIRTEADYRKLLDDSSIAAVVVATPTSTHATIAADALRAGKHVLVEKPLCLTSVQAEMLAELAEETGRVLMVGHVFLFNAGICKLRELMAAGELGHIHYLDAVRTNLGPIRGDVNALYDLGTHDVSICNYLLGQTPIAVSALGSSISQVSVQDVCFATLQYDDGIFAHLHVSWLNPRKVRTLTAVGSAKMAHWDDVDPQDTLRLFDKGLEEPPYYDSFGEFQYLLRSADVHVPAIRRTEPMLRQAEAFAGWVLDGIPQECGPREGLAVVATLEAANRSMKSGGAMCLVGTTEPEFVLKQATADAASVPLLPTPNPEEIARVRRRCRGEAGIPVEA